MKSWSTKWVTWHVSQVKNLSKMLIMNLPIFFVYLGGMYGLAAHEEKDENSARWMEIAKGITNTCHQSYESSKTKLGPEVFGFTETVEDPTLKAIVPYYILRPETFESYFIMWRLTHDQKYRDWGWEAVQVCKYNLNLSKLEFHRII